MLQRVGQRVWTLRLASSLAVFGLGWILLALISSTWFQPSEVQKVIEDQLPVLKIFHPDVQAWLLLHAWQPILALLLAALALAYSKSPADFAVEQWWRPPPDFLGLPTLSLEPQDFRSRATGLVGRETERAILAAFVNSATKFGWCWLFGAPGSG